MRSGVSCPWPHCSNLTLLHSEPSLMCSQSKYRCIFSVDLHAEISRQSRKQNTTNEEKLVSAEGVAATQNGEANLAPASQHANLMNTLESSPLIKANPSPQGTPLHTTFSGTQNFTPSTRISALNMVGDLLRKVGVS